MITKEKINEAIASGEIIKIIYHGGSQPGTAREISPIKINGKKVQARCYTSNAVKYFMIEKIELIDIDDHTTPSWQPGKKAEPEYLQISDVMESWKEQLLVWGWIIKNDQDYISLHRQFKNGKIRRGSDLDLVYEKYTYGYSDIDRDGNLIDIKKKRFRPWIIRGKGGCNLGNYIYLDTAVKKFLDLAAEMAPCAK